MKYIKFILFLTLFYIVNITNIKTKMCNLLLIFPSNRKNGPGRFAYYLNQSILEWNNSTYRKYCNITLKKRITISNIRKFLANSNNYIWFQTGLYLFNNNVNFKYVLYGPNLSPIRYLDFPVNNTHEIKWINIMNKIKYYVVHYNRISNHFMNRTNSNNQFKKYINFPCCMKYEQYSNILKWENRKFDFLIYIKYSDSNHKKEGKLLINSLNATNKVITFTYGFYNTEDLLEYAKNSKIVIYFSFYDTGAMALLEMQRMGVFTITLQKEFITQENGIFIPELENNIQLAILKIKNIIKNKYNSVYIANYNRRKSDCLKYLYNLVIKL